MKTNGLVPGAIAALWMTIAVAPVFAGDFELISFQPQGGNADAEELVAADDSFLDRRLGVWFAGSEVSFLRAEARSGGRITMSFDDTGTPGVDASFIGGQGLQDVAVTPRLWVGRRIGSHFGIVARYWELNDFASSPPQSPVGVPVLTNFATFSEEERLRMYAYDLEGLFTVSPGPWTFDGTFGGRHASLAADANMTAFGVFTPGNFVNLTLQNASRFNGSGVTGSLTGRRQITDTSAHFFLSGRASKLWGQTDSKGGVAGAVASSPSPPLIGAATVTRNNAEATATIYECQVGVQWDFELQAIPAAFFFRTAFEYQYWNVKAPPTGGAGFGGSIGDLSTNSFTSAGTPDAKLLGLSVATGITW
jgi:hypothetical protein